MNTSNPYKGREAVMFDFAVEARLRGETFFYLKIPENIGPEERGRKYEDPIQAALDRSELGQVTGGGSQLGEGKTVEFCGIDVVTSERDLGLKLLKRELVRLNAPVGSLIEEYLPERIDHPIR
ncbi:MAG: hypothetical protein IAE97_10070 [Chthoniobacterales bacterium]|nr:hypothetical protein [Chthoniobacterales bacterium]